MAEKDTIWHIGHMDIFLQKQSKVPQKFKLFWAYYTETIKFGRKAFEISLF